MKFKFVGQQGDKSDGITSYGIYFPFNQFVDVSDPLIIAKISNNSHFEGESDGGTIRPGNADSGEGGDSVGVRNSKRGRPRKGANKPEVSPLRTLYRKLTALVGK
jgi:hypothetical protein